MNKNFPFILFGMLFLLSFNQSIKSTDKKGGLTIMDSSRVNKLSGLGIVTMVVDDSSRLILQTIYLDYLRLKNPISDSIIFSRYYLNLENSQDSLTFTFYQKEITSYIMLQADSLIYENYKNDGYSKFKIGIPFQVN